MQQLLTTADLHVTNHSIRVEAIDLDEEGSAGRITIAGAQAVCSVDQLEQLAITLNAAAAVLRRVATIKQEQLQARIVAAANANAKPNQDLADAVRFLASTYSEEQRKRKDSAGLGAKQPAVEQPTVETPAEPAEEPTP